jgi:DNA-binding response OmpR family regulator
MTRITHKQSSYVKSILSSQPVESSAGIRLEPARWEAWLDNSPIYLTPTEYAILWCLARADHIITQAELAKFLGGTSCATVRSQVCKLRKKLRQAQRKSHLDIKSVRGIGYRLQNIQPRK